LDSILKPERATSPEKTPKPVLKALLDGG